MARSRTAIRRSYNLQTPSSARRAAGGAGPITGSTHTMTSSTVPLHGGGTTTSAGNCAMMTGGKEMDDCGSEESGSASRSMQHGFRSSVSRVQSEQQFASECTSALRTRCSSMQTRSGVATIGISIPKQASKNAAIAFRTVMRCHTCETGSREVFPAGLLIERAAPPFQSGEKK